MSPDFSNTSARIRALINFCISTVACSRELYKPTCNVYRSALVLRSVAFCVPVADGCVEVAGGGACVAVLVGDAPVGLGVAAVGVFVAGATVDLGVVAVGGFVGIVLAFAVGGAVVVGAGVEATDAVGGTFLNDDAGGLVVEATIALPLTNDAGKPTVDFTISAAKSKNSDDG